MAAGRYTCFSYDVRGAAGVSHPSLCGASSCLRVNILVRIMNPEARVRDSISGLPGAPTCDLIIKSQRHLYSIRLLTCLLGCLSASLSNLTRFPTMSLHVALFALPPLLCSHPSVSFSYSLFCHSFRCQHFIAQPHFFLIQKQLLL